MLRALPPPALALGRSIDGNRPRLGRCLAWPRLRRGSGPGLGDGLPSTGFRSQFQTEVPGGVDVRLSFGWRYSFRYSRSRLVCDRLTGISVAFESFILRM